MEVKSFECNVIAGFGNPLIDISARIENFDFLQDFNLKPDGQREVNSEELARLLDILKRENYNVTYNPGGCAQNTLRIIQNLIQQPSYCVFFGGLGDDKDGELLEAELKKCGVKTRYAKQISYSTGKVVALINGENRSLVANLGAADIYSLKDFASQDNLEILKEVLFVYIEGFFITHSFDVALEAVTVSRACGSAIAFNISGAYVADINPKELLDMVYHVDVVLGNISEFKALARLIGIDENIPVDNLAMKIHSDLQNKFMPPHKTKLSQLSSYGKTIVITQGKDPVICVCEGQTMIKHEVPHLDSSMVKDPTGAGDAFSAGFLLGLIQNKPLNDCLAYGSEIAQRVIKKIGVQL